MEDFDALHAVVDERFARLAWPEGDPVGRGARRPPSRIRGGLRGLGRVEACGGCWRREADSGTGRPAAGPAYRLRDVLPEHVGPPGVRSAVRDRAPTPRPSGGSPPRADTRPLLTEVYALEELAGSHLAALHFSITMLGAFGALGLVLSATGVYGVLAYGVRRRERELNIRAALGAEGVRLSAEVVRLGVSLTRGRRGGGMDRRLVADAVLHHPPLRSGSVGSDHLSARRSVPPGGGRGGVLGSGAPDAGAGSGPRSLR